MYKIYINHTALLLASADEISLTDVGELDLSFFYMGNKKRLHNIIDMMEKGTSYHKIIVSSNNLKDLWADFKSIFKKIDASGGIVFNEDGAILAIFRKGFWDLPKGKIEKGESNKDAALREVKEECGVSYLSLIKKADVSYHVYREKGRKILKKSIWYFMYSNDGSLTPQTEEDIEIVQWIKPVDFLSGNYKIYPSLVDILNKIDFGFWKKEVKLIRNK